MGDRTLGPTGSERCGPRRPDTGTLCPQLSSRPGTTGVNCATPTAEANPQACPAEPSHPSDPDSDFLRLALLLGGRALISESHKPGLFRGLQIGEPEALDRQQGLKPVKGETPKPVKSVPEGTHRHLRSGGNALKYGSDRISWTNKLAEAEALSKKRGTEVVRLDREAVKRLGIELKNPKQLLRDLAEWRRQKTIALAKAKGKNKIKKLRMSIEKIDEAVRYVKRYGEHHTVGPVPQKAVNRGVMTRIRIARNAGRILIGLSIMLSVKRVADAEPDRRGAVLADEVAGLAMDLIVPGTGPIGTYATQTARGELRTLSLLFPTVYTWIIDAYFGEILEEADPEGVQYIREAMQSDQGMIELMYRMFGVPYY